MIYEEKTFILKNGQEAVLRSPKMGEGGIYLDFLKNICQESEFVLMYPEEIRMNEEAEEQWIKAGLEDCTSGRYCYLSTQSILASWDRH